MAENNQQLDIVAERIKKQKEDAEKRRLAQEAAAGGMPKTPMGMAGIGANADQAKMVAQTKSFGTEAQTGLGPAAPSAPASTLEQEAIQEQEKMVGQEQQLQTRLGEQSFDEAQRDAAQEQAKAFSEKMQTFGSLGTRVENMVTGAFSGVTGSGEMKNLAQDVGFEIDDATVANLAAPGTSPDEMNNLLTEFSRVGRDDAQAAFQILVNNQSKFKNPSSGIMSIVDAAYKKDPATLHQTVANLVAEDIIDPDQVNFEHLISSGFVNVNEEGVIEELGVSQTELEEILGAEWAKMTPDQIGEAVEAKREEVLGVQDQIEAQLADPNTPPEQRVLLLNELKRMGAIGAAQYEQEAEQAQQEAADSGKIFIGGEVQDVAELLKDETIKADVISFLGDPESEASKQWKENNPEFAGWLERELESLNITKRTLEKNIGDFTGIQSDNERFVAENLGPQAGGARLSTEIMNTLGFGEQAFELDRYNPNDQAVYNMLNDLPDGPVTREAVNILNSIPASQRAQMKDLDPGKLRNLLTNPDKMGEFAHMAQVKDRWAGGFRNTNDINAMVGLVLGGGDGKGAIQNANDLGTQLAKLKTQATLGVPGAAQSLDRLSRLFDQNKDGIIDDPGAVRGAIDNLLNEEGDLSQLVDKQLDGYFSNARHMPPVGPGNDIYQKIDRYIGAGDTRIDRGETEDMAKNLSLEDLERIKNDQRLLSIGVSGSHVDQLQRQKAKDAVDGLKVGAVDVTTDSLTGFSANPGGSQVPINNVKELRGQLEQMASSGHPYQREAAKAKYKEFVAKTVEPRALPWDQVYSISTSITNDMKFDAPLPGYESEMELGGDGKYRLKHVKLGGYKPRVQDLVHKIANWSAFANNKNDGNEFSRALSGVLPSEPVPRGDFRKAGVQISFTPPQNSRKAAIQPTSQNSRIASIQPTIRRGR